MKGSAKMNFTISVFGEERCNSLGRGAMNVGKARIATQGVANEIRAKKNEQEREI